MTSVQLYKDTGNGLITIIVGKEAATMHMGDWSRLLSQPKCASQVTFPDGMQFPNFVAPTDDPA